MLTSAVARLPSAEDADRFEAAVFAASVLHSLDHAAAEQLLADPLWLEAGHEEWGRMAVLGQLVR